LRKIKKRLSSAQLDNPAPAHDASDLSLPNCCSDGRAGSGLASRLAALGDRQRRPLTPRAPVDGPARLAFRAVSFAVAPSSIHSFQECPMSMFTVRTQRPRNPYVAASHGRKAGAHRRCGAALRQQGKQALRRELQRERSPNS
jgi:hypothetical protein